jgi:SNF2 family DNA or RNA helicase
MSERTLVTPQLIIRDHLRRNHDALLFCGMGLGKTAAVLHHLSEMFLNAEAMAALIIAPLRVANLTWPMECQDWPELRWMRIANLRTESGQRDFLNQKAHLYTCNYESLHLVTSLVERRKGKLPYDCIVWDELTKSKNPSSKRINHFRRKVQRPLRNYGLTGTPMPNSQLDLFAQVRLIDDGKRLGTNFLQFKREYFFAPSTMWAPWKPKADTPQKIEKAISDITCTLKSSDWLDIPDTIIEDVEIPLTPELQEKYETLEKELVIELRKDKVINVGSAAALVTKLQQFTSGEMYCDEGNHHPIHDLKFKALAKVIKEHKQPVFVVCAFKHEYVRMKEHFPQSVFFNDAKTPNAQMEMLKKWNAKQIPILFAHPASAGHGINLQYGSSIMVFISLTYNREYYDQTICRFARRGQTEITRVYRLLCPSTVDDAVAEALANKAENESRLIAALQMLEQMRHTKGT